MATDLTVTPDTRGIRYNAVSPLSPKLLMVIASWETMNFRHGNAKIGQDGMPKLDRVLIVFTAERKIPDHLETSEMRAVTNQVDVVGSDARLQ